MESIITTFHPKHSLEEVKGENTSEEKECILCGKGVNIQPGYYYCRTCKFQFHKECATSLMESSLTVYRPETHEHTLTFIRQKNAFKCDACGEVNEHLMNMYCCLQCNFFVHTNCIHLPKVIKITRHPHRLFHTLHISNDGSMSCRVCYQDLAYGYGGYICIDKTCDYKVHSHCATNSNVWDGKDVEGEPEEISTSKDVGSSSLLEEENGKRIRHFSHHHDLMRLSVSTEDEDKGEHICQACILPIVFDSFLSCKKCDFALHNTCASLPRRLEHAFHQHPLTLHVDMITIEERFFTCSICERESNGFMYRCCQEECGFRMDAKCASIAEPFINVSYSHPFSISKIVYDKRRRCRLCWDTTSTGATSLCGDHYLDFRCATLPELVRCNYGNHRLTLTFGNVQVLYWCDLCEELVDAFKSYYACHECNTTRHFDCVIGRYPYLKPGHTIKVNGQEIMIASNRRLSRPICSTCHYICQDKLIFINHKDGVTFCSIKCINSFA